MADWIHGQLKMKGKVKDIRNFILNELNISENAEVVDNGLYIDIYTNESVSINNLSRNLIGETYKNNTGLFFNPTENIEDDDINSDDFTKEQILEMEQVFVLDFSQVWSPLGKGLDVKGLTDLSKKYNLDIKLYAYNYYNKVDTEILILKNQGLVSVINHSYTNRSDYNWNAPAPMFVI